MSVTRPADIPDGYIHQSDLLARQRRPHTAGPGVHGWTKELAAELLAEHRIRTADHPAHISPWWYELVAVDDAERGPRRPTVRCSRDDEARADAIAIMDSALPADVANRDAAVQYAGVVAMAYSRWLAGPGHYRFAELIAEILDEDPGVATATAELPERWGERLRDVIPRYYPEELSTFADRVRSGQGHGSLTVFATVLAAA